MKDNKAKSEYLLDSALKIAPLGWWEWDLIENKVELSDEVYKLIDQKKGILNPGIEYFFENVIDENFEKQLKANINEAITTGIVPEFEYQIRRSNGTKGWLRLNGIVLKDDADRPVKILGTMLDITDYKKNISEIQRGYSFLDALMHIIPNPIFYKDSEGIYQYCNEAFSDYLGIPKDKIIGSTVYDIAPKELAEVYHEADLDLIKSKGIQIYEANVKYADDSIHDVIFNKSAHIDEEGNAVGLVGLMHDITVRKNSERLIAKQNEIKDVIISISQKIGEFINESQMYELLIEELLVVFENADSGTVLDITEDDFLVIQASSKFDKKFISSFKILLKESFIWHHNKGVIKLPSIIKDLDVLVSEFDFPAIPPHEIDMKVRFNLHIPVFIDGKLEKIVSLDSAKLFSYTELDLNIANYIQEQIPILHKLFTLNQQTIKLSRYDSLTELMNRRFFEIVFEEWLELAKRKEDKLIIVLFDLDNLKKLNDKFGHLEGDHYIQLFSKLVSESFRSSDKFARLGGDEFSGLFMDSDVEYLNNKLESLRNDFSKIPFGGENSEFIGRFSYGISSFPSDGNTTVEIMSKADQRMYIDKNQYKKNSSK